MSMDTGEVGEGTAAAAADAEVSRLAALLRGGRPPYPNRLSPAQMDSLKAFCNTLLPSLDISAAGATTGPAVDEALVKFYRTSASMAGVPEDLGGLLSGRLQHPAMGLLRLSLWMLSTWYGTLAIGGRASLSKSFPYVRRFSEVEQAKREEILTALSFSSFFLYSMLYRSLKFLTLRFYFQKVDENNDNHSWKAIGYCGPDPELAVLCKARKEGVDNDQPQVGPMGPLNRAIVDMSGPNLLRALHTLNSMGLPSVHTTSLLTIRCDAVVVGSGSGGAVVAGVLAKAGFRVVVLDKGRYFPTTALSLLEGPSTEQMYESGGLLATDDVGAFLLAGSTVGGGSVVNWSACIRTPDHVLDEWCDRHELKLFGGQAYRDALDAVCARMDVRPSAAAGKAEEGLNSAVLRRGCSQLGYTVVDVPVNAAPGHDCGWCHLGCKDGKKKSTTETWLADLANSGNGVILDCCRALRVMTKGGGERGRRTRKVAAGVVAELEHGVLLVVESTVTVVACGSLNTPALLRRSGLRNPNIGRHLHLHPTATAWGYFPEKPESNTWQLEPGKGFYSGGILTSMSTVPSDTGYGAIIQTPAMHPGMSAAMTPWTSAADFRRRMLRFSRTATLFTLARDRGSGCSSKYPASLTYKLDAADEANLQRGMERMLRILAAAGAEELGTHHHGGEVFRPRGSSTSAEEFEAYVRRASRRRLRDLSTPITSAHQMGSCRMGVDPETSGVNPNGETWEVERLFVADTSVFPTALGVNPMVTVQAIAYCTAQNVLEALSKKFD